MITATTSTPTRRPQNFLKRQHSRVNGHVSSAKKQTAAAASPALGVTAVPSRSRGGASPWTSPHFTTGTTQKNKQQPEDDPLPPVSPTCCTCDWPMGGATKEKILPSIHFYRQRFALALSHTRDQSEVSNSPHLLVFARWDQSGDTGRTCKPQAWNRTHQRELRILVKTSE